MERFLRTVGPNSALEILGVKLVGANAENGRKLLFTLAFLILLYLLRKGLQLLARLLMRRTDVRAEFWSRQGIQLAVAVVGLLGVISIWFDNPERLTTALGLVTAGLAFALQKVVTSVAGYFVILRGQTFNIGDRIVMGGVRGDVIALGFTQTTIMEMGQPPGEQGDAPSMWVKSRQYTGRIVTVPNGKVFEEAIYNYTREFPFIWEELTLPVTYTADRQRAERILLDAAERHQVKVRELSHDELAELRRRYFVVELEGFEPQVYFRLTDNWLELTVRFLTSAHGVRDVKDAMSREILRDLDAAGIGIASATFEIVGLPPLRVDTNGVAALPPA